MPHPTMFRDDDPVLAEVRAITMGFPEAFEKVSHGRPAFFVSKMFAMYGGSTKPATKGGDYIQYPQSIMVHASYRMVAPKKLIRQLDKA
jgi:hypothetical protein